MSIEQPGIGNTVTQCESTVRVSVLCVDIGDTVADVQCNELKQMPAELSTRPPMALSCRLQQTQCKFTTIIIVVLFCF